jgi:zinc protease
MTFFLSLATIPGSAAEPTGLRGADGVLRATLPNGLRVVIVPDRLAPVVTTKLNYLVGSNDAPEGFPGTAHALEHMMFRGSEGLDRDQLAELGALLGGAYHADTTETVTQYTYTVPANDLAVVLRSEALRMRGLSLNATDWEQERGAIEQEVARALSSPLYTYPAQLQAILFEGTPYAHDALGTRASFERTDVALLRQFYQRWYAPNNAILVIAGAVRPAQALAEVQAAFGAIPRRPLPHHIRVATRPVLAKTLAWSTDFPVGLVVIACRMPWLKEQDFAAADILADVLGSQRGALYGLVPAGRALTAQFSYQPKADVGLGMATASFPAGSDPAPLLSDLRRIIAAAAQEGVSPELVAAARQHELAQRAFQNDSIEGLAGTWSEALAFQGAESPEDLARAYAAVTVEDVNRLARLLLDPDHAVTAILTPRDGESPVAEGDFGGAESLGAPPDHPVALPPWASSAVADLRAPDPVDPPDVSVLPNGLRLIVQPEHVSRTVSVFGRIREVARIQEPPGKEGISALMHGLFRDGTRSLDRLAFRKALDDIAAVEGAGPSFLLKVLSPAFERGMQLLADNVLRPAFPASAFAMARAQPPPWPERGRWSCAISRTCRRARSATSS